VYIDVVVVGLHTEITASGCVHAGHASRLTAIGCINYLSTLHIGLGLVFLCLVEKF